MLLRAPQRRRTLALLAPVVALGVSLVLAAAPASGQASGQLVGTFSITPGACSGGASGSYFRMVHPTGSVAGGPFVDNGDSACSDHSYTLLTAGSDGGLLTGGYQPAPSPGFDGDGNSLATRLFQPVPFFGVRFAGSTNPTDLQTGEAVPAPSITADGGSLSGDLSAFDATWNRQAFNQGSPKPGGGRPGNTTPVTGTFDAATGAYTLTWASQIVGGPFNNFTGVWHLEGRFTPAASGGGVPAGSASGGAGSVVTTPAQPDATTTSTALASTPAAGDAPQVTVLDGDEALALASVQDDGYQAPTWLVLLLALLGIGGVVALLLLPRRSEGSTT
jgi:hypothetical protein